MARMRFGFGVVLALVALARGGWGAEPTQPLWELGVGAIGVYAPDYPASGAYSLNGLPFPYILYRGDLLRLGGDAPARLVPFQTERVEFGISLDAAFGAPSDDNPAREGMPDLNEVFEVGPELVIRGPRFGGEGRAGRVDFALQGRAVFEFDDFEIGYQGLTFEAIARYRQRGVLGPKTRLSASIGPVFGTEGVADYLYQVDPAFARPGRPAFNAGAGYLGTEFRVGLTYLVSERFAIFGSLGGGVYAGAENADSPLFEEEVTGNAVLGFAYSFALSPTRVPAGRR